MKQWLLVIALLGTVSLSAPAQAQGTEGWQLLLENDETAIYAAGPVSQEKMKADGMGIRIHSKREDSDMHLLVKAGCEEQQLYVVAGMDMDPDDPIEDALMLPPMKKFTLDAPKGSLYGRLREMICRE